LEIFIAYLSNKGRPRPAREEHWPVDGQNGISTRAST